METERELFLHYWTDNNLPYDGDDDDMEVAWTAWQAKIDDLQKLRSLDEMAINQLAQANQVWQIKCDGLKKKLDRCREESKALLMKLNLPYGYKLVPVETTDEMRMAAYTRDGDLVGDTSDIYKAMIEAVP